MGSLRVAFWFSIPLALVAIPRPALAQDALSDPPAVSEPPAPPAAALPPPPPPAPKHRTFDIDPVSDGAVIGISLSLALILDKVSSTGELRPQQISSDFDNSKLLGIDRAAVTQTVDSHASTYSNIGLYIAAAYAVIDPFWSGFREHNVAAGVADGVMYAESFSLSFAMTNMVKIAVRRPRPIAYQEAEAHKGDPTYSNADTDSALSFFSNHSSTVGALGATATYLAFVRSPHTARPWITLTASLALSTFVSVERVRAGAHFPTDVIAGTLAGAGVGLIVPHLHRSGDISERRVWVGFAPASIGEGGTASLAGIF